jgi:predicted ATP-dependent serine protease
MSSFVKLKKENAVEIAGVKTSIRNWQIVSTGSDSFNHVIGGGVELNSVVLIGKQSTPVKATLCVIDILLHPLYSPSLSRRRQIQKVL